MRSYTKSVLLLLSRYNPAFQKGIARYAGRHGWHLNIEMIDRGVIPYGWMGDGIITTLENDERVLKFIRAAKVPTVDLVEFRPDIPMPRVVGDNRAIGILGAEHFLERGFTQFAWYSESFLNVDRLRFLGFKERLAREGFAVKVFIRKDGAAAKIRATWKGVRSWLGRELKRLPKPLALMAFCDYDASTVIDACQTVGLRVPEDVAVLGVNNSELICDYLSVPLSSVNHDMERIGFEGSALLDRLMHGATKTKAICRIPPKGITLRRSTDILAVSDIHVRKAIRFMQQGFAHSIGSEEIAAAIGIQRRHLERLFQQVLGRTIHDELIAIRLRNVCALLAQTDLSAGEISRQTGFCHPSHLANLFREKMNETPRAYRLRLRGNG